MRRLLIVLAMIVAVALVADFAARDFAESRLGAELQSALELSTRPDASIGGFPFLMQVVRGRLTSITLDADGIRSRGVRLSKVSVELRGVRFSLGQVLDLSDRHVRIQGGTGRAELTDAAVTRAARRRGAQVTVRFADGRASLTSDQAPGGVDAELSVEDDTLVVAAAQAGPSIRIPLPEIARGLEYRSVEIRGSIGTVTFTMGRTTLELSG